MQRALGPSLLRKLAARRLLVTLPQLRLRSGQRALQARHLHRALLPLETDLALAHRARLARPLRGLMGPHRAALPGAPRLSSSPPPGSATG